MNNTQVIAADRLEQAKCKAFNTLDVSEGTRMEYMTRINYFLRFTEQNGLHEGSYLDFKRFLANNDTYSVSTKNKYLIFRQSVFRWSLPASIDPLQGHGWCERIPTIPPT